MVVVTNSMAINLLGSSVAQRPLPDEVVLKILENLGPYDLLQFSLSSRQANRLARDPSLWRNLCIKTNIPLTDSGDYKQRLRQEIENIRHLAKGFGIKNFSLRTPREINDVRDKRIMWEVEKIRCVAEGLGMTNFSLKTLYEIDRGQMKIIIECANLLRNFRVRRGSLSLDETKEIFPVFENREILFIAALIGHADIVDKLIQGGAEVNQRLLNGATPLWFAAQKGHLMVVKFLFENEADVNLPGLNGTTSLWQASMHGHYEVVEFLIENGADVNCADIYNNSALWIATKCNYAMVVSLLKANGAVEPKSSRLLSLLRKIFRHLR